DGPFRADIATDGRFSPDDNFQTWLFTEKHLGYLPALTLFPSEEGLFRKPERSTGIRGIARPITLFPGKAGWIDTTAMLPDFVVDMRAGGVSGSTGGCDNSTALHGLTGLHVDPAVMRIYRTETLPMLDDHYLAVSLVPVGKTDDTV